MVAHTFAFDFHLGVVPKAESLDADPAYMEMPHPKVACSQARLNHLLGHAQFIKKIRIICKKLVLIFFAEDPKS